MRWLLALLCLSLPAVSQAAATPSLVGQSVDKVLVVKSERKLQLISRGQPMKSYRISLGKQPSGAKQREGDLRTPEGLYWIDWRKTSEKYQL
ncbi:L,D-transpeptidase family protein, partial [Pseudomonas sp. CrR25]|nr:L,D-transpeptidase family protein [Pseudomonas sp. CrR25]